jgi:hypothetical protein
MKGLFKSKPRTPADVVRQTRELLIFIDLNSNISGAKREEKVNFSISVFFFSLSTFNFTKFLVPIWLDGIGSWELEIDLHISSIVCLK